MFEVIILSLVQGITEFLPISSSAHLILVSKYFNFNNQNLTLDVSLHFGSLLAVILYFKKDIFNYATNKKLLLKIILSSVPVVIFGFLLIKFNLIDYLRSHKVIGWSTIIFGIVLYYCDKFKVKKSFDKDYNYSTAIRIGLFQILSLVPGVSRSGVVMSGAQFFNFNRIDAAKISFLMSIPALGADGLFNTQRLMINNDFSVSLLNILGIFLSFLFSYITIKFFIKFLQKFNLVAFVVYRIILGFIILVYGY